MKCLVLTFCAVALLFAAPARAGTYTFYSTYSDGQLQKIDGTWSGACGGVGASVDTTSINIWIGDAYSGFYAVDKGFLMFRITGIPEDETIATADFHFYVVTEGDEDYVGLIVYKTVDWEPLDSSDWTAESGAISLDKKPATEITAGQYNTFPVGGDKLYLVEKNVTLYVCIVAEAECASTEPTTDRRVRIRSANASYDPYLEITTTGGGEYSRARGPIVTIDGTGKSIAPKTRKPMVKISKK